MNDAAIDKDPPGRVAAVNCERTILHECYHFRRDTEEAHGLRNVPLRPVQRPHVPFAEAHCRLDQCIEHRFQIERRATDDLEHIGSRSLLLQRFAQLVEQACVLDGDHGLSGEILQQLDLLVGERPHLLAIDNDYANRLVLLEHRRGQVAARRAEPDRGTRQKLPFRCPIGNVNGLLSEDEMLEYTSSGRLKWSSLSDKFRESPWYVEFGGRAKRAVLIVEHDTELGPADPRRILQHGLKYRLQLAG